ncbi:MAG: ATP-dependent helicase RecG [Bacteroidota bacterium]
MANFFETKIEFLKGVGPQRAAVLQKELRIFSYGDLIQHYPFRYEDRSVIHKIRDINDSMPFVQLRGKIISFEIIGEKFKKRLVATLIDDTGSVELVWFQGIGWVEKQLAIGAEFVVFGKPNVYHNQFNIPHPELDTIAEATQKVGFLQPVYHSTEKLRNFNLDSKGIAKLQYKLLEIALPQVRETLPDDLIAKYQLTTKKIAVQHIHFPKDLTWLEAAKNRLKFEELFYIQLKLISLKVFRKNTFRGQVFKTIPLVNEFYKSHLPFDLTNAQKRVVREIYADMCAGKQMNRLLQGDVGSGKTIVGFICMLMAIDNQSQACIMAPTEILADQHYTGLKVFAALLGIPIAKLTGSTKKSERVKIHEALQSGELKLLVGTHALLEDVVQFNNLGLCIIDEQHRFGVAQRAKLWGKNKAGLPPHILVMTATPIPRTLAMTLYGDLDASVIDEMPAGRKPIKTVHRKDAHRLAVFGFMKDEIKKGRQVYIVYPLIEESAKLDLKDLMDGYESITRAFPEYLISIVHGKMKPKDKDFEMQRFVRGETQLMVATTVIEVGVNVPNASVMVIENAERFGLSQLHQLRGRVGRGAEQSYCILMSSNKISSDGRTRLETMVQTDNGFEIADVDLKLRGPGDLAGTQQSGVLDLLITDLAKDGHIVKLAREAVENILATDPLLSQPQHERIRLQVDSQDKNASNWSRIS